jgi:DNA polymerase theta
MEAICRLLQLPPEICRSYALLGVRKVYDWQLECLRSTGIIEGNNLVYCAPTSGGKTLVAELLMLKAAAVHRKKVIFVLPYVSLVMEKEKYMKRLLTLLNRALPPQDRLKVRGFYGDQGGSRSYKENILVCTIEKANGIFNSLIMRGKGAQLGCIVFDEMHVLGNTFNGYLLEILIR